MSESDTADTDQKAADRLIYFSDAVVAIAITLLALDLTVPEGDSNAEMLRSAGENADSYLAFLISFGVISGQWFAHHRLFRYVIAAPRPVPSWNMLWLLMIVITPFATKVVTEDGAFQIRFAFYAVVQALASFFLLLAVRALSRQHGLSPAAPPDLLENTYERLLVVSGMFLLSIPIALFTKWAFLCWVGIPYVGMLVRRVRKGTFRALRH